MSEGPNDTERPGAGPADDSPGSTGPSRPPASHRSRTPRPAPASDSPPWERPRYWNAGASDTRPRMEPTRVDDLLARLGSEPDATPPARRRRDNEGETVPAGEFLATFGERPGDDQSGADEPVGSAESASEATTVLPARPATDEPTLLTHPAPAVPPRIGPHDPAPIRDLSTPDDAHTEELPRLGRDDDDEARTIRASLAAGLGATGAGAAAAGTTRPGAVPGAAPAAAAGTSGSGGPPPRRGGRAPGEPPLHRHPRWLLTGRVAVALVMALLFGLVGWNWNIIRAAENGLRDHSIKALRPEDSNIIAPTVGASTVTTKVTDSAGHTVTLTRTVAAPAKAYTPENILLIGSDTRADGNGNSSNSDGNETTAQSDTLMIAHLSADRQHVTILSIPRDTKVPAPSCYQWNSNTGKVLNTLQATGDGERWKITNAYAVGGPACTVAAVQKLSGIRIDRLIGIDFNGFKGMVDAVGGIQINICRPIIDRVLHTVVPTAGLQTIVGDEALNLVRARDVIGDNLSDLARIHRQQLVLSALLRQVSSAKTLLNPSRLDNFLQAFTKNTFNQNVGLNDLVELASSLGDLSPGQVTFYTLPTVPDSDDPDSLAPDPTKAAAVFDAIRNDELLPGQTSAPSRTTTPKPSASPSRTAASPAAPTTGLVLTVDPAAVKVQVYNVTGQAGVGSTVEAKLNAIGFKVTDADVVRPDNQVQSATTVEYSEGGRAAALTVAAAVPGATLVPTAGLGSTVRLMVGSNYDGGDFTAVTVGQTAPSGVLSTAATVPTTSAPATTTAVPSTVLNTSDLTAVNAATSTCA